MTRLTALPFFFLAALALLPTEILHASDSSNRLPNDVTILTRDDFVGRPYTSVADALDGVPGLNIDRSGTRGAGAVAQMRGLSGENTLVLIDGRPIMHDYNGVVDLSQIPINIAERIEITRGGAALRYGSEASGGAINIVTSRPEQKGVDARLGTGLGRRGEKDTEGRLFGRSDHLGDLTYLGSNAEASGYQDNAYADLHDHFGNITRSFNGKGYWSAEYSYHESQNGEPGGTAVPFNDWNSANERSALSQTDERLQQHQSAKLGLSRPDIFGGTFFLDAARSWREMELRTDPSAPDFVDEEMRTDDIRTRWERGGFEAGGDGRLFYRKFHPDPTERAEQYGAYASYETKGNRWMLKPAVRVDHNTQTNSFITPRLVGTYDLSSKFRLSASAERSHKTPTFDDIFLSSATAENDLSAAAYSNYDLGFDWSPAKDAGVTVTGFSSRSNNAFVDTGDGVRNEAREQTAGVEAAFHTEIGRNNPHFHYRLRGAWTELDARRSVENGDWLSSARTPREFGSLSIDHFFPRRITVTHEIKYQGEQFSGDGDTGVRLPSYYVWNIRLGIRVLAADLYAQLNDVTNRHYADGFAPELPDVPGGPFAAPQSGRAMAAGVSVRFQN